MQDHISDTASTIREKPDLRSVPPQNVAFRPVSAAPIVYSFPAVCQVGHSTPQRFTEAQVRGGAMPFVCGVCRSRWTSSSVDENGALQQIFHCKLD